jgi:hypothetical protein
MTPEETEILIETRNDVRWLVDWSKEHKQQHSTYLYGLIAAFVASLIGMFK